MVQVVFWQSAYKQGPGPDTASATLVYTNVEKFIRRAETIGFLGENKDRVRRDRLEYDISADVAEFQRPTRHPLDCLAHLTSDLAKPFVPDARKLSGLVLGYQTQ